MAASVESPNNPIASAAAIKTTTIAPIPVATSAALKAFKLNVEALVTNVLTTVAAALAFSATVTAIIRSADSFSKTERISSTLAKVA